MTTYTIPGFSIVFDPITEDATSFTPNTDFTTVAPDASTSFTYTYDNPGDPLNTEITISSNDYSATVGGSNIPLSSAIYTEAINLEWGGGNMSQILLFIFDIGGIETEFVMFMGGTPLPVMNTLADFQIFDATITGDDKITSGPFAPGVPIPYYTVGASENDTIVGTASDETFDGGAGNDSIDGGVGNDTLDGGVGNDVLLGGADIVATQYTIPSFSLTFDPITDATTSFDSTVAYTIDAANSSPGFSYTYDNPGAPSNAPDFTDVTVPDGDFAAFAPGGLSLDDALFTEIFFIDWGASNTTVLFLSAFNVGGVETEFITVIGGDALPAMSTIADFDNFEATITGEGQVTTGPFAPGAIIPFNFNPGTTTSDISALGGDDTLLGGAGFDQLDGGSGNDVLNPGENVNSTSFIFDTIFGSDGNDTIIYTDNIVGFQELNYSNLGAGITVSLNGSTNTATVDKGVNGTDTITDIINPLVAGWTTGGLGLYGSTHNDIFNITMSGNTWMQARGFEGADTFNITLNGGLVRMDYVWATSGINVNLATGVVSNDGDGSADTINVTGTGGNLEVRGSEFTDTIVGGAADERFILKAGSDSLDGGAGIDLLRYDRGGVTTGVTVDLAAGTATGTWDGAAFAHTIAGIESVRGSKTGDDDLTGNGLANTLTGGGGNDTLHGGGGVDQLFGGADNDIFTSGTGADTVDGGAGIDTIDYSGSTNAQTINMVTNVNIGGEAHNDTLISIENLIGSDTRGDKVTGTAGANEIHGMGAGDILRGFNGDDFLFGGANNDFLYGGRGADALDGGTGIDWAMYNDSSAGVTVDLGGVGANGFAQGDTYVSIENIRGSIHDDTITGDNGINKIIGDAGHDSINGMGGRDNIRGGIGNDTLDGGAGTDGLRGDAGDDIFVFKAGNELDNVLDFDDFGNDQIDLSSFGFATYADVQLVMGQAGGHVRIDLGGSDILLLRSTLLADMGADDFIL